MKRILTLCIYEKPSALYDILHWEKRFAKHISIKHILEDGIRINVLPKLEHEEVVLCIPSEDIFSKKVYITIESFKKEYKVFHYNKLLMFGSFPFWHLSEIGKAVGSIKDIIES